MPPCSQPLEIERLSRSATEVDFALELAELPGLRSLRGAVAGSVQGHVHFGREQGVAVAELTFTGSATLECQRCMRPMQQPLEVHARFALAASETEAERVPQELETVLAPGGRTTIAELVTEELLLTLPIVPLHAQGAAAHCTPAPAAAAPAPQGETHKPFARLGELLKR
ncbi:MAG TPA: YceD family protein [Steroidobacteraceae bacterium]|nr:YceD family protein [Steroidobacteraceae bacterium]